MNTAGKKLSSTTKTGQEREGLLDQLVPLVIAKALNEIVELLNSELGRIASRWSGRRVIEGSLKEAATSLFGYGGTDFFLFSSFNDAIQPFSKKELDYHRTWLGNQQQSLLLYSTTTKSARASFLQQLANRLLATTVASDFIRWDIEFAATMYDYFFLGVPSTVLVSWLTTYRRDVTAPILTEVIRAIETSRNDRLSAALKQAKPKVVVAIANFKALARSVKKGVELSSRITAILDMAMLILSAYEMALDFSKPGPPAGGAAFAVASTGSITVLPLGIASDWYALLEKLIFIGAISPNVLMSQATSGSGPGTTADDESDLKEDAQNSRRSGIPKKDPEPAPEDLYSKPIDEKQAAAWKRQVNAFEEVEEGMRRGKKWKEYDLKIRKRYGLYAQRLIYPEIVKINGGGRGLTFYRGALSKKFIQSLLGKIDRVTFLEASLEGVGRFDVLEVNFPAKTNEVIDITSQFSPEHFKASGAYRAPLQDLFGFKTTVAELYYTSSEKVAETLVIRPVE
jgi:hypothetical protein